MRIAFVWDWPIEFHQALTWKDGLAAAIRELSKKYEIKIWACGQHVVVPHPYFNIYVSSDILSEVKEFNPDVILMWGDCTRPNAQPLSELKKPMALCFAGGDTQGPTAVFFDHFFVESQVYFERFKESGKSVSVAFGTNIEIFKPIKQPKIFDAVFPATFCDWKRHNLFTDALKGLNTLCFGYMYDDHEQYCYLYPQEHGVAIAPHLSAEATAHFLNMSKTCVITSKATGGSQRTVLEAMACNIPVIVMSDSDKTTEYAREGGGIVVNPEPEIIREAVLKTADRKCNTRDYILGKWSHLQYAYNLEQGLCQLV